MSENKACPKCGAALTPEAPQGLCPKCLLEQASFPTEVSPTTRHHRPAPPNRDELANAFPHLQIIELIGQGGMGFVYKARQPKLDRIVALKILAQPLAEQTHFAERFTREGRTLAKLSHPNIVIIHDFGQAGPFFFLLMEYVDGVNLRQAMKAGAIDSAQVLAIVPRICEALQYAHNEGVLHRDIKPDNILLDTRGRIKIADFGIAKLMAETAFEHPLTASGASLGTPHYMAPEQIEHPNTVDHRADIYSLGVVFYEMLTGELPLGRFSAPSEKSGSDPRLDKIVFQTLEKQPDKRPQSADEVRTRVETVSTQPHHPITFKMARCYITTPEFLQSWFGRLLQFSGKGELRLDPQTLTFVPRGNWIVIPLQNITSLSLGKLSRHKYISITFTEKGEAHRIFLVPNHGAFVPFWETNQHVEEWFASLKNATQAPSKDDDHQPLPNARPPNHAPLFAKSAIAAILFTLAASLLLALFTRTRQLQPQYQPPKPIVAESQKLASTQQSLPVVKTIQLNDAVKASRTISVRSKTTLDQDERLFAVIRYGSDAWGTSETATSTSFRYSATNDLTFSWTFPESFAPDFEVAAALQRLKITAAEKIGLLRGPVELFTATNTQGQVVSAGLSYYRSAESDLPAVQPYAVATISESRFSVGDARNGGSQIAGDARATVPHGYRLVATFDSPDGGEAETAGNIKSDVLTFSWTFPRRVPTQELRSEVEPLQRGVFQIPLGAPLRIFTSHNGEETVSGYLQLLPARLPQSGVPTPRVIEFTSGYYSKDPNFFRVRMETDLFAGESLEPVIRYQDGEWEASNPANSFTMITRGPNPDFRRDFTWSIPEAFSYEFDVVPTWRNFSSNLLNRPVPLSLPVTTLFAMTNSSRQKIACGVRYKKVESNANIPTLNGRLQAISDQVNLPLQLALPIPNKFRLQGFSVAPNNETVVHTTDTEVRWKIPQEFLPLKLNTGFLNIQMTTNQPYEVFALTNAGGQVFRAFIELVDLTPKTIELSDVNLEGNELTAHVPDLAPNEKLIPFVVNSQGQQFYSESKDDWQIRHKQDTTHVDNVLRWEIPEGLRKSSPLNFVALLRERYVRKALLVTPGSILRLAPIGTETGGLVRHAALRYEKIRSDTNRVATIKVLTHTSGGYQFTLNFDAEIPEGCRLNAESNVNGEIQIGRVRAAKAPGIPAPEVKGDYFAFWTLPDAHFTSQTLYEALAPLKKEPIKLVAGQPREVLSYTNAAGKVFKASLRLDTQ